MAEMTGAGGGDVRAADGRVRAVEITETHRVHAHAASAIVRARRA